MEKFDPKQYLSRLQEAAGFLRREWGEAPETALVLGSGLGDFIEDLPDRQSISYTRIPHFPQSTVVGHSGRLTRASHAGQSFCAMQGRIHFYEGQAPSEVVLPVRVLSLWGVSRFVITNAAGAVNTSYQPGDLMLIRDHINLLGDNPLCGPNLDELGERFPDMTHAYDPQQRRLARQCAGALSLKVQEGVYAAVLGPSYETPAEIRMLRAIGADAVGMSTVPETIALNHLNKSVLGISCITNMAAGILEEKMRHEDVLETTARVKKEFAALLLRILEE